MDKNKVFEKNFVESSCHVAPTPEQLPAGKIPMFENYEKELNNYNLGEEIEKAVFSANIDNDTYDLMYDLCTDFWETWNGTLGFRCKDLFEPIHDVLELLRFRVKVVISDEEPETGLSKLYSFYKDWEEVLDSKDSRDDDNDAYYPDGTPNTYYFTDSINNW